MELLRTYAPCVAAQVDLLEHVYTWQGEVVEIMGDGKYWNHARTGQNTGNHPEGKGDGVSSYATRDIDAGGSPAPARRCARASHTARRRAGEELFDDYSSYDRLPWFEKICREAGAASCVEVGLAHAT